MMLDMNEETFAPDYQEEFLKPIVTEWLGKFRKSEEGPRKQWKKLADECMHFYESTANFMWEAGSEFKFWEGVTAPTFRIVIAKAFELVAQIGPSLFFKAPERTVTPRRVVDLPPAIFGDVENDPQAQQMYQAFQQESSMQQQMDNARAKLMETWLNFTPHETPGGGLEEHAEKAITEALIKGRGVLWPEPYQMPGSDQVMTGLFYDTVDNLFIDPDAEKIEDAGYIIRRRCEHYSVVEKRFSLPAGSLRNKATLESVNMKYGLEDDREKDKGSERLVYLEVFSRSGLRLDKSGLDKRVLAHMNEVAGEHVYLAICPSVDYPLNLPAKLLHGGASDDEVRAALAWPIPFWADQQFPTVMLDFYPRPRSVWPLPPLAPGIGELKFLNVIISHLCNRIWSSSRDFIAVAKSAQKEVEEILLRGNDLSIIPVSDAHKDIKNMISFLDQPDVNFDVWQIVDRVSEMFDKRVGLTDLVYGLTRTQSRSAEDAATKRDAVSARPDHMARKVEKWMSRASAMEAMCTRWFVSAKDVVMLMGNTAAQMWSLLIDSQEVESVTRELEYSITAGSGRRRNHEMELANINQALQFFFPELSKHADVTTDVGPLNELIQRWADAAQIDLSAIELGPRMPPPQEGPSPEEIEMQMKQEEHQMDMQSKQFDLQSKQTQTQMQLQAEQAKIQLEQAKAAGQLQVDMAQLAAKGKEAEMDTQVKGRQHLFDLLFSGQEHKQEMKQDQEKHVLEMRQLLDRGRVQLQVMKQQSAAKAKAAAKTPAKKPAA